MKSNVGILNLIDKSSCAVLGYGVSNRPLVDFLLSHGASVTVYDQKDAERLRCEASELAEKGVRLVCGKDAFDKICEDLIFRSPGIRPDIEPLAKRAREGAVICSEMELFFELCPAKTFAITGSDGKTTSTTLTYLFFEEQSKRGGCGKVYLGGNIGNPLLPEVEKMTGDDIAVLELSSFQLMGGGCTPHAAAITNITPNHLNWHTDMEEYIAAKCAVVQNDTASVVLNSDNAVTRSLTFDGSVTRTYFSSTCSSYIETVPSGAEGACALFIKNGEIVFSDGESERALLRIADIKLPGKHNIENYMTAIGLTYGLVDPEIYSEVARTFGGVEHRLEFVARIDGVSYYNSSIDSSPTRTAAALSALDDRERVIVLCGGSDKNIDFLPLAEALTKYARAVVLNGEAAQKIRKRLDEYLAQNESQLQIYEQKTLSGAMDVARQIAQEGDTVLLSPACASFDQFTNFVERGRFFKNTVLSWRKEEN